MMITHLLVVFGTALAFCFCNGESSFQKCAESIKDDKPLLCKISKLEVDGNMPKVKDYMNCALKSSGWTNADGTNFIIPKLVEDMSAYGYNKQKELKEVTEECKNEFGSDISAIDYLTCLLIDEKTKKEFKMTLMVKEADFFPTKLVQVIFK